MTSYIILVVWVYLQLWALVSGAHMCYANSYRMRRHSPEGIPLRSGHKLPNLRTLWSAEEAARGRILDNFINYDLDHTVLSSVPARPRIRLYGVTNETSMSSSARELVKFLPDRQAGLRSQSEKYPNRSEREYADTSKWNQKMGVSPSGTYRQQSNSGSSADDDQGVPLSKYQCGATPFSTWSSYILTAKCDQVSINQCCIAHDKCYSDCQELQMTCDQRFCSCLQSLPANIYCRNVVHATHCSLVQWFGHEFACPAQAQPPFGGGERPFPTGYPTNPTQSIFPLAGVSPYPSPSSGPGGFGVQRPNSPQLPGLQQQGTMNFGLGIANANPWALQSPLLGYQPEQLSLGLGYPQYPPNQGSLLGYPPNPNQGSLLGYPSQASLLGYQSPYQPWSSLPGSNYYSTGQSLPVNALYANNYGLAGQFGQEQSSLGYPYQNSLVGYPANQWSLLGYQANQASLLGYQANPYQPFPPLTTPNVNPLTNMLLRAQFPNIDPYSSLYASSLNAFPPGQSMQMPLIY